MWTLFSMFQEGKFTSKKEGDFRMKEIWLSEISYFCENSQCLRKYLNTGWQKGESQTSQIG